MPSLIGNKPNQVPSNGDLGTLAFQDASNVLVGKINATEATLAQPLPAASGGTGLASVGTSGNVLTSNGTAWTSAAAPASGKVLQVVSTTKTDTFSMTGSTYTSVTGLSASITPTSATSKILVIVAMTCGRDTDASFTTRLLRGGTAINIGDAAGSRTQASTGSYVGSSGVTFQMIPQNMSFLDSPATTSSTTYEVQLRAEGSGQSVFVNRAGNDADASTRGRFASTITIMEIAA